jgi:hypothetical protein
MPFHYRYGIRNVYRPSRLAPNAYGWTGSPQYNRADVPTALMERPVNITQEQFEQQFAYEWFQSGEVTTGNSNPPFVSGAAGRLIPILTDQTGRPARILRGYIRRAQTEAADPSSKARLYFMYNPEMITRDYVSYLEQTALDPFNTVYQSGNLVAPPSILDFSFDLFFDRQEEATQANHPGVYVDYQFFDLVVRNVVPTDPNQPSATLPDNGVMMVNPRDITVVFSPQFTVQGRPLNARVTFEKFTHRMTPIRMRISLMMRAVYMGPVRDMTEYRAEEFPPEASIPIDEVKWPEYAITFGELEIAEGQSTGTLPGATTPGGQAIAGNYGAQQSFAGTNNGQARAAALDWAKRNVIPGVTRYSGADTGSNRYNLPQSADCSGLIVSAYKGIGMADAVFGGGYPGTSNMLSMWASNGYKNVRRLEFNQINKPGYLEYGDILIRNGHIRFFDSWVGNKWSVFDAASTSSNPQVGSRTTGADDSRYIGIKPMPLGQDMAYNATNRPTAAGVTLPV